MSLSDFQFYIMACDDVYTILMGIFRQQTVGQDKGVRK